MVISLTNIGKQYSKNWILRGVTCEFKESFTYGITGSNGTGKSTLLKIISSVLTPSEGDIFFSQSSKNIDPLQAAKAISFAAPYIDLVPEMTLIETLNFHFTFKNALVNNVDIYSTLDLIGQEQKQIRALSSGMQQRLKVGLALLTNSEVVLLDEPTSNLDEKGINWYHKLLENYSKDRTLIIASNVADDFRSAGEVINTEDYK